MDSVEPGYGQTATAVANVMAHGTMQEMLLAGDPRLGSAFGCMLAMPLHLGLSVNSTLTSLDIENNRMGDVGAIALGCVLVLAVRRSGACDEVLPSSFLLS